MSVDLALLRREAELLKQDFDNGEWVSHADADFRGFGQPRSNPGAVAERCIALIDSLHELFGDAQPCPDHEWNASGSLYCNGCDRWVVPQQLERLAALVAPATQTK